MTDTPHIVEVTDGAASSDLTDNRRNRMDEALARMAVAVGAQRAEVYRRDDRGVRLAGSWVALGHEAEARGAGQLMPVDWFPWTLGNIQHARHVFVQNAGPLPVRPDGADRIGDLGMGSSLYLPIHDGLGCIGAVCLYWADERLDWPSDQADRLCELARTFLLGC